MNKSTAPCLHNVGKPTQCYKNVINGSGYCERHQPEPYRFHSYGAQLSPQVRRQVLTRDRGVCYMCLNADGAGLADGVEHVLAKALGGSDSPFNLKAVHDKVPPFCHRAKTNEDAAEGKRNLRAKPRRRG